MDDASFKSIDRDFLRAHVDEFISMCLRNMKNEYWDEVNFLTELPGKWHYSFFVADAGLTVRAFIIASEKEQSVHIHKFVVDKPFQSEGLGGHMLNHIIQQSRKPLTLKVSSDNAKALSFYKRNGFIINSAQQDMYHMIRPI